MKTIAITADDLIGSYRTFGTEGPAYRVMQQGDNDKICIKLVDSGEEMDYPISQALADPEAE